MNQQSIEDLCRQTRTTWINKPNLPAVLEPRPVVKAPYCMHIAMAGHDYEDQCPSCRELHRRAAAEQLIIEALP